MAKSAKTKGSGRLEAQIATIYARAKIQNVFIKAKYLLRNRTFLPIFLDFPKVLRTPHSKTQPLS